MSSARDRLATLNARWCPRDGVHTSPIPGISCIKVSRAQTRAKRHWHAALCLVVQGVKEIALEGRRYRHRGAHYVASVVDLPVTSRVMAVSPERPFLCLKLAFDSDAVRDVSAQLDRARPDEVKGRPARAMFIGDASDRMIDAAVRLVELFATPDDAPVLGPLVMRELVFHLLKGPDGPAIRQIVRGGTRTHRITDAIFQLQASLDSTIDVAALAKTAGMSRAVFFRQFKEATAMSPLQYHKRLRLLEARRLMVEDGESAEVAARRVGYASASQFSRDYARMFGNAPLRDTRALRRTARRLDDG
jgi:AraC-like DNA-binding protein